MAPQLDFVERVILWLEGLATDVKTLNKKLGSLLTLTTTDKTSIVNAINEIDAKTSLIGVEVKNEIPEGIMNNSNTDFIAAFEFVPESLEVIVNGMVMKPGDDYVNVGTRLIRLTFSPDNGESILINYTKA